MDINDKAIESIITAITRYIKKYFKSASFDVTKQGIIEKVLEDNKYSVQIQGTVLTVFCSTGQIFKVGDNVLVLFAQNNMNRKYIIGRSH